MSPIISFSVVLLGLHLCNAVPKINPFINQTSNGTYTLYGVPKVGNIVYPTVWYQDDLEQKLMLSIGIRGVKPWMQAFWFFKNTAYEVSSTDKNDPSKEKCIEVVDFNYTMEIRGYDPTYLSYMGDLVVVENNRNRTLKAYAGQALDGVGPLNTIASVDEDGLYAKLAVIGGIGAFHFGEYYLSTRNNNRPDPKYFIIPDSCRNAKKEYFFHKYDLRGRRLSAGRVCGNSANSMILSVSALIVSVLLLKLTFY